MMLIALFARMKKKSEAEERGERQALGADHVAGHAVADERVAALAEVLQLARARSTACARRRPAAARIAAVAITQDQRDAGDLEVDAEHGERDERLRVELLDGRSLEAAVLAAFGGEQVDERGGAGGHRCPFCVWSCVPWPASLPARGRARGPSTSRGRADGAVLDDHQVDGHRQAEERADQGEDPRLQPAVEQPPDPAPHDDPREHRPGDPPAHVRPTGLTCWFGGSRSSVPASRAVLGHRSGHYLSRVTRAFPGRSGPAGGAGAAGWAAVT